MSEEIPTMDDLIAAVSLNEGVEDSALLLIDDLAARLAAIPPVADPNILRAIIDGLRTHREPLAAAILANTPAAPAPPTSDARTPAHSTPATESGLGPDAPPIKVPDGGPTT